MVRRNACLDKSVLMSHVPNLLAHEKNGHALKNAYPLDANSFELTKSFISFNLNLDMSLFMASGAKE